uniref:SWIM-type domain-containing protein n=1 Tax=Lactuca sativa TaxID=4236 RepID=A0A9R1VLU2_LACSA|nr:hypothetical protein LSAT_V11C500240890 [Lactuca sativa]
MTELHLKGITSELATNSAFRKRFHSIIWNSKLEPHVFEKEWKYCLHEFNISNNKWMQEMYGLHRRWVPTFFKDIPMSGLMITTSLSEGQNWSFQNNTLTDSYLLMFMMTFEGVMECQRRNQVVNDFNTATTVPRFITSIVLNNVRRGVLEKLGDKCKPWSRGAPWRSHGELFITLITSSPIEPHASKVYTRKIFYLVQKEISDSDKTCFQMSVTYNNGQKNITTRKPSSSVVDDKVEEYHYYSLTEDTQYMVRYFITTAYLFVLIKQQDFITKTLILSYIFQVTHSKIDGSYKCTCMHFEHVGLLCRNIFCVFKYYIIEQIPKEYIMRRRFSNSLLDSNSNMTVIEIFSNVDRCVSVLNHDASKLKSYLEELNELKKKFVDDCPAPEMPSRESFYNQIIGVQLTNDAPDIDNPSDIRNKGTGSRGKRLKSKKEMLEKACSKRKRKCALCKQLVNHDKCNCPLKKRD